MYIHLYKSYKQTNIKYISYPRTKPIYVSTYQEKFSLKHKTENSIKATKRKKRQQATIKCFKAKPVNHECMYECILLFHMYLFSSVHIQLYHRCMYVYIKKYSLEQSVLLKLILNTNSPTLAQPERERIPICNCIRCYFRGLLRN